MTVVEDVFGPDMQRAARGNLGAILIMLFALTGAVVSGTWAASTWWYGKMVDDRIEAEMRVVNASLARIESEAAANTLLLNRLLCLAQEGATPQQCELQGRIRR